MKPEPLKGKFKYNQYIKEFLQELKTANYWFKPDGKPKPEWKLIEHHELQKARDAAWDAAWDATRDAAWDAGWDAAWDAARDAAWDAARDAARDAAWDAAWDAASDAARDAAWGAARDAARDAALFAQMLVCYDLPMDKKHLNYCNSIMEVWRKGYCLYGDVNGVLYVYAKEQNKGDMKK